MKPIRPQRNCGRGQENGGNSRKLRGLQQVMERQYIDHDCHYRIDE
jgi:hypothetical protein